MQKLRIVYVRDSGREIAHEAVSRRPPISLYTVVARTHMFTYDARVWDLSIIRGPFSVARAKLIRNFCIDDVRAPLTAINQPTRYAAAVASTRTQLTAVERRAYTGVRQREDQIMAGDDLHDLGAACHVLVPAGDESS